MSLNKQETAGFSDQVPSPEISFLGLIESPDVPAAKLAPLTGLGSETFPTSLNRSFSHSASRRGGGGGNTPSEREGNVKSINAMQKRSRARGAMFVCMYCICRYIESVKT